jgi:hypothetical protein
MAVPMIVLGLLAAGSLSIAGAQDRSTPSPSPSFVEAWRVSPTIDGQTVPSLITFTSDGLIFTSTRPMQPAPAQLPATLLVQSLGQGSWIATGSRTAEVTFVFIQNRRRWRLSRHRRCSSLTDA